MIETLESKINWVTDYHFHLLKVNALVPETRTYIACCSEKPENISLETAVRERWFGNKSDARVKNFLQVFYLRYQNYPEAFRLLTRYHRKFSVADWQLVVMVHLMISDPFFRWFATDFLGGMQIGSTISTQAVFRGLATIMPEHIRSNTRTVYAQKLLTAATAVGLVKGKNPKLKISVEITQLGLYYVLFLLQSIHLNLDKFIDCPIAKALEADRLRTQLELGHQNGYWHLTWYGTEARIQLGGIARLNLD